MLKQYIGGGKTQSAYLEAYTTAMGGVRDWLLGTTAPPSTGGLTFIGEMSIH